MANAIIHMPAPRSPGLWNHPRAANAVHYARVLVALIGIERLQFELQKSGMPAEQIAEFIAAVESPVTP